MVRWGGDRARRALAAMALLLAGSAVAAAPPTPLSPEMRVLRVGWRMAVANAERCPRRQPLAGLSLHDLSAYAAADRARVAAAWGFGGTPLGWGFGVRDVVPGSPADAAGIRVGDEIVAAAGVALAGFARAGVGAAASPDRGGAFAAWLAARLAEGPVALTLRRGDAHFTTTVGSVPGCAGDIVLASGDESIDAWSDGEGVAVSAGLVALVPDDDGLAFIIGHEMAHNSLGDAERLRHRSRVLAQLGIGSAPFSAAEIAADRLGLTMAAAAGYDWHAADPALRRILARRIPPGDPQLAARLAGLAKAGAALEAVRHP